MMQGRDSSRGLPIGWQLPKLEEVLLALESGSRPRGGVKGILEGVPSIGGEHILYSGGFDFSSIRFVPEAFYGNMNRGKIEEGDVLVVKDGATTGKTGFVSASFPFEKAAVNEHVFILRVPRANIEPKYLFYWMQSPDGQQSVRDNFKGTAQGGINTTFVKNSWIPLAPLREQQRIVAEIETQFTRLDAGVAALNRAQANLRGYKASALKAACEGRLVRTEAELARQEGRDYEPADVLLERILVERRAKWVAENPGKKYKEPKPPDTSDLPELPEGWVWTNLAQLKRFSLYGPRFSSKDYREEGRLVLRTSDISESGKVDLTKTPRLPLDDDKFARYRCEIGDVLVTRTGSLGTLAVFNDEVDAIPGAYLIQYRLVAPMITSWYVFHLFKSPGGQRYLVGQGAGVGRPNLNAPTIEAFPIPLPPLPEQHRIVAEVDRRLSVVGELEKQVEMALRRAERLRQAILKHAFEGKLVPQDPNDEPASAFQARIKAERSGKAS